MKRNTMAMAALGLGAAFLMRNKDSREKLKGQVNDFTKSGNGKGMLDQVLNSFDKKKSTTSTTM
ncbi:MULTISPECIES: hypothetical protein [Paenisporosarcina]|jgi:hypothetical protein|uniref:Uncharacterized protein n=1 Tax=Paenisporosarcina quisquiliarum TaxID=365346 RepID=A0A9X3LH26_9BACL|nr:hypothetical protein [Paenisporosarcina quisquiliarum]MCZ8537845.1 hypothetical protein [Paenisporosarcina quisquiliarum]